MAKKTDTTANAVNVDPSIATNSQRALDEERLREKGLLSTPTLGADRTREIVVPPDAPATLFVGFVPGLAVESRPNQVGATRFAGDGPFEVPYLEARSIVQHFPEAFEIVEAAPTTGAEKGGGNVD